MLLSQAGHVADKALGAQEVKELLSQVRGKLVDMPLDFLIVRISSPWAACADHAHAGCQGDDNG